MAPGPRPWRWPRPSRIPMWSPSRCTGAGWPRRCSARSTGKGDQYPPGPWRRSRRAGAHVRARIADRGAGVLPRPVAQGPPPQAQAAATRHRRPVADRRAPAASCTPPPTTPRVRRADRRGRRRRSPLKRVTAATASRLGGSAGHQVRGKGARRGQRGRRTGWEKRPGMSITERSSRRGADPGTSSVLLVWDAPTSTWASAPSSRRPSDGRTPAPIRRAGPLAAESHPPGRCPPPTRASPWSRRPPFSPISPLVVPTLSGHGSRHCVTWVLRYSPNPKIDDRLTSTSTCSTTFALRRDEGLAGLLVASADGRRFRRAAGGHRPCRYPCSSASDLANMRAWALASDTLEFVDLEDIPGVFREPLPRIGLDSLPEQGAWLQPFRPLSSLLTLVCDRTRRGARRLVKC